MATEDWPRWSTLPPELLRLIAESFLKTNNVDRFRAVCPSWRAATDDPKNNPSYRRFQPRQWIVLDEVFRSEGKFLVLNTATGRFLHKRLPLLGDYHYLVATTHRGYFVLADKIPPHTASVLNPLTDALVRFAVPMPLEAAIAHVGGSLTMLVLLSSPSRRHYPGIEANCVYYTQHMGSSACIYKCNISDKKAERISEAVDFVKRDKQFVLVADRPFTIIHIVSSYTINILDSQLALQYMP